MRKDIQGLRAIAVIAVLFFHFWPDILPGGYVGVDIFFVISGFLITLHLLNKPPIDFRKLADFWAKRIRRLLPAATLVLFMTVLAGFIWLPSTMMPKVIKEAIMAAVYLENWELASSATNYLEAEDGASPIQQFWTLSIEEQYYLIWPILIGLAFTLGRSIMGGRKLTAVVVGLIFTLSFIWSVYLTNINPEAAYFVTTTRLWELALGGIIALLSSWQGWSTSHSVSRILAWAGLSAISLAIFIFNEKTPFPGYTALLPTMGAALVILAATDSISWSPRKVLGGRLTQFLGDNSYSLYLWHWPIVVIAPFAIGQTLSPIIKTGLLLLTICLAVITKRFFEDPVRYSKKLKYSNPKTFAYGLVSVMTIAIVGFSINSITIKNELQARSNLEEYLRNNEDCVGAGSMRNNSCTLRKLKLMMTPTTAKGDVSSLYGDDCWSSLSEDTKKICTYGNPDSDVKIALIGNSHAGMWHSALAKSAKVNNWRLDTYVVSKCYTVFAPLDFQNPTLTKKCTEWNKWAVNTISDGDYSAVVISNRSSSPIMGVPEKNKIDIAKMEYGGVINKLVMSDKRVLVIRDAPGFNNNIPDCIASNERNIDVCNDSRENALEQDPLFEAALESNNNAVSTLDLTNLMCEDTTCFAVIGGLIVHYDKRHLSNTFVDTLYPEINEALKKTLVINLSPQ